MAPQELAFAPLLCSGIQSLSHSVPGIGEAVWTLSLPLRHYGRLMSWPRAAPWICVGVPDSALAVDADHPLMQGCHEFLVWRELVSSAYPVPADTVVGTEGYAAFIQTERHAISLGEQIMAKGPWKDSYWRWRQTVLDVYPPQTA